MKIFKLPRMHRLFALLCAVGVSTSMTVMSAAPPLDACYCAAANICSQVCFALRQGHQIPGNPEDFAHTHPVMGARDRSCRAILGHAHEFDSRRSDQPNNFNINTMNGATESSYVDTPPPNTLYGLNAPQWDKGPGGGIYQFPNQSIFETVYFRLSGGELGQCEGEDFEVGCDCGGTIGHVDVCLKDCNPSPIEACDQNTSTCIAFDKHDDLAGAGDRKPFCRSAMQSLPAHRE